MVVADVGVAGLVGVAVPVTMSVTEPVVLTVPHGLLDMA